MEQPFLKFCPNCENLMIKLPAGWECAHCEPVLREFKKQREANPDTKPYAPRELNDSKGG